VQSFDEYLKNIDLDVLLGKLDPSYFKVIAEQVRYFTEKETEKRDHIVLNYFGEEGIKRIVDTVVDHLLSPPKLEECTKILDVGAGTGFFTVKIADKIRTYTPKVSFYAMDITPAMLQVLSGKTVKLRVSGNR